MPIDKMRFTAGMAVLAGAYGREIDAPVQRAYYQVLSPQLTTDQFEQSVTQAMAEETFWPSPAVLLSKVKSQAADGLHAFEHVNRVCGQYGGFRFLPHEVFKAEFDERTQAAIKAVGGLYKMANTTEERYNAMRKKFIAAYHGKTTEEGSDALVIRSGRDLASGERDD